MTLGSFINIFKSNLQPNYFEMLRNMQIVQKLSIVLIFTVSTVLGRRAN